MSNVNINVKGKGQLNIGNIAQGRNINLTTRDINDAKGTVALVTELLQALRDASVGTEQQLQAVTLKVQELGRELTTEPQNATKIKGILDFIKEHHSWAFTVIRGVTEKVIPILSKLF